MEYSQNSCLAFYNLLHRSVCMSMFYLSSSQWNLTIFCMSVCSIIKASTDQEPSIEHCCLKKNKRDILIVASPCGGRSPCWGRELLRHSERGRPSKPRTPCSSQDLRLLQLQKSDPKEHTWSLGRLCKTHWCKYLLKDMAGVHRSSKSSGPPGDYGMWGRCKSRSHCQRTKGRWSSHTHLCLCSHLLQD